MLQFFLQNYAPPSFLTVLATLSMQWHKRFNASEQCGHVKLAKVM